MKKNINIPGWVLACLVPSLVLSIVKLLGVADCHWWVVIAPSALLYFLIILWVVVKLLTIKK